MVFRRDNKVDQFQRQMSALRHQIGGEAGSEQDDMNQDVPDIADDRFPNAPFDEQESTAAADIESTARRITAMRGC